MQSSATGVSRDRTLSLPDVLEGLLSDGLISRRQYEKMLSTANQVRESGTHPLTAIADQNLLSPGAPPKPLDIERLTRWLAKNSGLPYLRIDPLKVDVAAVTQIIKHAYATRFNILPVAVVGKKVTIATAEPFMLEWERELTRTQGLEFERVVANPAAVKRYLREFYAVSHSISGARHSQGTDSANPIGNLEQLVELGRTGEVDANDQHIVRIVDWLLQYAFDQQASDIHLEPRRGDGYIRFRIDGVLHLVHQIPTPVLSAAVSRIKALGRMDVIERRRPQDGRVKTKTPNGKEIELRLSTMPTTFGEKLVMRIFDPDVLVKNLEQLGFSDHDQKRWQTMTSQPHGIVIVTGPTGSGKTTSLYSALKTLAKPHLNVCTIEDPIELVDPQINQMAVHHAIGLTFAEGLRTLLRQDPDIIMVGEIRDMETADAAIQAALTGHLVLTTLHTNDAPSSIIRLLDLGVPPYLIRAALLGIVAQRLVRTLCEKCKRPTALREAEWQALTAPRKLKLPTGAHRAVGCDDCRHTGYRGRSGIFEILTMSPKLRSQVTAAADGADFRETAIKEGMVPLRLSGALKVKRGLTTPEEIFQVVSSDAEY